MTEQIAPVDDTHEEIEDDFPIFEKTPRTKPPYMVVGDTFVAQTSDGELKVPLRFKTKLFRKLVKSDADEVEQFMDLIEGIGDSVTLERLDELDIFESAKIAGAYFKGWRARQGSTVGEASRSSRS